MTESEVGAKPKLRYEELTEQIIGAAIEVHRAIGPGLFEKIYEGVSAVSLLSEG